MKDVADSIYRLGKEIQKINKVELLITKAKVSLNELEDLKTSGAVTSFRSIIIAKKIKELVSYKSVAERWIEYLEVLWSSVTEIQELIKTGGMGSNPVSALQLENLNQLIESLELTESNLKNLISILNRYINSKNGSLL